MRALIVFLKDTFYTARPGSAGAAQWNYHRPDVDDLRVKLLGSGALVVYRLDAENGEPQAHLNGERALEVAFFPAGGWSGRVWEDIEQEQIDQATTDARRQEMGLPAPRLLVPR